MARPRIRTYRLEGISYISETCFPSATRKVVRTCTELFNGNFYEETVVGIILLVWATSNKLLDSHPPHSPSWAEPNLHEEKREVGRHCYTRICTTASILQSNQIAAFKCLFSNAAI